MTRAYIVTDLSYGDAGKGTTVDYLSRQGSTVVVRHNGGPQAGHNVVTPEGRHHCFSQFGSGTFAGARTFLSKYMLVNPLNMMNEAAALADQDVWSRTFIDQDALVITPYHVAVNRLEEKARGAGKHGSCGQGIGVTQRLANEGLSLHVRDLKLDEKLAAKLEGIRWALLREIGPDDWSPDDPDFAFLADDDAVPYLAKQYRQWYRFPTVVPSSYLTQLTQSVDQVVFEGAQGVLLDEWYGFHPYTTWSTTTHENAYKLLAYLPPMSKTRLGVIRTVTTRHGMGPHMTEDAQMSDDWEEPHNVLDQWQGNFRVGPLDLVAHRYAVAACGGIDEIAVTHLDRSPDGHWRYCDRYRYMRDIPISPIQRDLPYQEALTHMLEDVEPIYTATDRDGLMAAIEESLGPISIASMGPTCADKVPMRQSAGV